MPGERKGTNRTDAGETGNGGLLRSAATELLELTGTGSRNGGAKAAESGKRLVVVGDGPGEHSYEIITGPNGSIETAAQAGGNDEIDRDSWDGRRADGTLYHWNADTYRFFGELAMVGADGSVSFHFPDGAFRYSHRSLKMVGRGSGRHEYEIASNSADIELDDDTTEAGDTDPDSGTDVDWTPDRVSGVLKGTGVDTCTIGYDPVQNIRIKRGNVRVD